MKPDVKRQERHRHRMPRRRPTTVHFYFDLRNGNDSFVCGTCRPKLFQTSAHTLRQNGQIRASIWLGHTDLCTLTGVTWSKIIKWNCPIFWSEWRERRSFDALKMQSKWTKVSIMYWQAPSLKKPFGNFCAVIYPIGRNVDGRLIWTSRHPSARKVDVGKTMYCTYVRNRRQLKVFFWIPRRRQGRTFCNEWTMTKSYFTSLVNPLLCQLSSRRLLPIWARTLYVDNRDRALLGTIHLGLLTQPTLPTPKHRLLKPVSAFCS